MDYQAEVERLTAGADPTPREPDTWPTPGQWIHEWNQASATFVMHVQPDDVLLIGNVNSRGEDLSAALQHLRDLWPERRVVMFDGDIDVEAVRATDLVRAEVD